ncbi:MAG: metallophosphoesterase [Prevotella sp.]|nr:metallophosphoesterase [Prevotella sp.]
MVSQHLILFLILIILPDIYIYAHFIRPRKMAVWKKLAWWIPGLFILTLTVTMATLKDFIPNDRTLFYAFLLLIGVCVATKAVFALCSIMGRGVARLFHSKRNWGNLVGIFAALFVAFATIYGLFVGFGELRVRKVDFYSAQLPRSFDGYRIALFSDAHVGSYQGKDQQILKQALDSINAMDADMVCFAGDLINMRAEEIEPHRHLLNSLQSRDGVFSILGNHDYSDYVKADSAEKVALERRVVDDERALGWTLLLNENRVIRRGGDSIFVAGMENHGKKDEEHNVKRADIDKTVAGIPDGAFILMLQHDPWGWHDEILPRSKAQLTLSGHTHGGQVVLFGWAPAAMTYNEYDGMYDEGDRSLFVSSGLGGLLPMRFGIPGEVVLVTLHSGNKPQQP